jgi:hypothetical protein
MNYAKIFQSTCSKKYLDRGLINKFPFKTSRTTNTCWFLKITCVGTGSCPNPKTRETNTCWFSKVTCIGTGSCPSLFYNPIFFGTRRLCTRRLGRTKTRAFVKPTRVGFTCFGIGTRSRPKTRASEQTTVSPRISVQPIMFRELFVQKQNQIF